MTRNLATSLPRRARGNPMQRHDCLPPDLRRWLHSAALPWSATSALRLWRNARAAGADPLAALSRAEARMLACDCARIWGAAHPQAGQPPKGC